MKKEKHPYRRFLFVIVFISSLFSSCEKNNEIDYNQLFGIWVSTDQVELLDFRTETDLYKNSDHYNYSIAKDSITIQYSGVLYIYVKPTTHHSQLKGNELTIDFRPNCYGFRAQIIKFIKQ